MAKTKKYSSFRDFYEDEGRARKPKLNESKKQKDKFKHQTKFIDPQNLKDDDWDEFEEFDDVK